MNELPFRIALALLFVLFIIVRMFNITRAATTGGEIEFKERNRAWIGAMRKGVGLIWLAALVSYVAGLEWVNVAALPFPVWVRWAGAGIGYLSLPLIWWTEFSLGKNFNTVLHVREGHTLVTHGPYRWVRHPMYTALFLFAVSALPISANLLIGLPGALALIVIVLNRVKAEESLMLDQFGDQYHAYMERTGRFLPRLG
jgi:protein-S-isoprenylcysteine O-methyltransferase Ste14